MIEVIGVRFKKAGKIYYFNPNNFDIQVGDNVIVETARGIEYGQTVIGKREISEEQLVSDLKPVIRLADETDAYIHMENRKKAKDALDICDIKIKEHNLDMKLVDCEYTFDNNKVIFYFIADGRVDFRDLVKDLASIFRTRIELRQIGVRDQAKMVGGLAGCGQECCCKRFLGEFAPVSIKMAKDQSLSLNPTKIAGLCGRLMCCLRYEEDVYTEKLAKMPYMNSQVLTCDGKGYVVDGHTLTELIKVKVTLEDGTEDIRVYPLEEIKILKKTNRKPDREDGKIDGSIKE